jgi:hypothetical protein
VKRIGQNFWQLLYLEPRQDSVISEYKARGTLGFDVLLKSSRPFLRLLTVTVDAKGMSVALYPAQSWIFQDGNAQGDRQGVCGFGLPGAKGLKMIPFAA